MILRAYIARRSKLYPVILITYGTLETYLHVHISYIHKYYLYCTIHRYLNTHIRNTVCCHYTDNLDSHLQ